MQTLVFLNFHFPLLIGGFKEMSKISKKLKTSTNGRFLNPLTFFELRGRNVYASIIPNKSYFDGR